MRGPNNLIFMVQEDIEKCLQDLIDGKIEVSRRNYLPLKIEKEET